MDYSEFSIWISYASYASIVSGFFALLAAKFKNKTTASLFILFALASSGVCLFSAYLAMNYKLDNFNMICEYSKDGQEITN
jgi:hypothetical protein